MRNIYAYILFVFLLNSTQNVAQTSFRFFSQTGEPENVDELTTSLTAGLTNDSLKVVAVYKWITNNISYDYSAFMSGEPLRYQSPELVYKRRKTTCTGYSNLMVNMLEKSGIRAFTVEGFTQDFVLGLDSTRLSSDHAWVAFALGNNWYVADPTWDAGDIGIMKYVQNEKIKRSFFKRLFSIKIKNIFSNKKRRQIQNKTLTRERVTYKIGFNRYPTMDYLFADPNDFLKTHLPNVAHIQMKSAPVSVEQFCDSIHSVGDLYYTDQGIYDYNKFNNEYYAMEEPNRMLWLADSALNFHSNNHGDKAINAHNYLAYFNGGRSNSRHLLEQFKSISDTVIVHGNMAIAINKKEMKRKRTEFSKAFLKEKNFAATQNTYSSFVRSRISANSEIYKKGRDRINNKELLTIQKIKDYVLLKYGQADQHGNPSIFDSVQELNLMQQSILSLADSVTKYQFIENPDLTSFRSEMDSLLRQTRTEIMEGTKLMNSGVFLNESKLLENDIEIQNALQVFNNYMRDDINAYLSSRKSYAYLLKMDQEVKKASHKLDEMYSSGKIDNPEQAKKYLSYKLLDLAQKEENLALQKVSYSYEIENAMLENYRNEYKYLSLDLKDLNQIRTMRQAYLTKLMNNKYNRSIKVYTIIMGNAKRWKNDIDNRLESL